MRLQFLIPHWNEKPEEIEPLLASIELQQGIDFKEIGAIISYDGSTAIKLPLKEWRNKYSFEILDIHPKKGGVSNTRNEALNAATADYVMFCDADDMFCDTSGLFVIFREINTPENFDVLISNFREQTKDQDGNLTFVNHEMDSTFVHGKVFKRQYLLDNNIRFNPKLTIHEDSFFNIQAQSLCNPNRTKYYPQTFYLWKWRDESVCRHDKDYILKTFINLLDSNDALIEEFLKRNRKDLANQYIGFMIWETYYTLNKKDWREKVNKKYRDKTEKRFADYYKKYKKYWKALNDQDKVLLSNQIRQRNILEGMLVENFTIDQWLHHIEKRK